MAEPGHFPPPPAHLSSKRGPLPPPPGAPAVTKKSHHLPPPPQHPHQPRTPPPGTGSSQGAHELQPALHYYRPKAEAANRGVAFEEAGTEGGR